MKLYRLQFLFAILIILISNRLFPQLLTQQPSQSKIWESVWYLWEPKNIHSQKLLIPLRIDYSKLNDKSMLLAIPDTLILKIDTLNLYMPINIINDLKKFQKKNKTMISEFKDEGHSLTISYHEEHKIIEQWLVIKHQTNSINDVFAYLVKNYILERPQNFITYIDTIGPAEELTYYTLGEDTSRYPIFTADSDIKYTGLGFLAKSDNNTDFFISKIAYCISVDEWMIFYKLEHHSPKINHHNYRKYYSLDLGIEFTMTIMNFRAGFNEH